MTKRKTTEEFIEEAKKVHNNKYNYSKTTYINAKSPITVICPIHGEFKQRPDIHLSGHGCPKCTDKSLTTEIFIKKAKEIHGFKYDYSKSVYKGYNIPLRIICSIHGEFMQKPHYHLSGSGCYECGKIKSDESKRKNNDQFVEEAKRIHSDKYDYSEVEEEIYDMVVSILGENNVVRNDREVLEGKELDIYIPSKNLAI